MCVCVCVHAHTHAHTTCTDLQQYSVVVDPVHQRVLMWSVREGSQHAGYRHWQHIHQVTLHTKWEWEGKVATDVKVGRGFQTLHV